MTTFHPTALGNSYAKALVELAAKRGQSDAVAEETADLFHLLSHNAELRLLLADPMIRAKEAMIRRLFEGKVSLLTLNFLLVVAQKGRLAHLGEILASVRALVSAARGEVRVLASVHAQPSSEAVEALQAQLSQALGKTAILEVRVKPYIIGGITLQIGDKLVDASVATRLRRMRESMTQAVCAHVRAECPHAKDAA